MALVVGALKSNLGNLYGKMNASPNVVGMETANYYMQYLMGGINAGGGPVTGVPQTATAGNGIGETYATQHPHPSLVAKDLTNYFGQMASSVLSVYQASIVVIPAILLPDLIDLFSKYPSSSYEFSNGLADALDSWTATFVVSGVAPGPSPFSGALS